LTLFNSRFTLLQGISNAPKSGKYAAIITASDSHERQKQQLCWPYGWRHGNHIHFISHRNLFTHTNKSQRKRRRDREIPGMRCGSHFRRKL